MPWPTPDAYHEAIQNPQSCFFDPELKVGQVATDALGLPRVMAGQFASVYEVQSGGRRWAVRCFLHSVTDQRERYHLVSQHLYGLWLSSLVAFEYQEEGIRVQGHIYSIVKMEWVEGVSLSAWVEKHRTDAPALHSLAAQWRGLVNSLRGNKMAHGDLQHGNVLVTPQGHIKFVDYDAMFVPALQGRLNPELGHANYQHPQRAAGDNNEHLDNFSALVIYLSLRALAAEPDLWKTHHTCENLILSSKDFKAPAQSSVFAQLERSPDPSVLPLVSALITACTGTAVQTPEFANAVTLALATSSPSAMRPTPLLPMPALPPAPAVIPTAPALQPIPTVSQPGSQPPSVSKEQFRKLVVKAALSYLAVMSGGSAIAWYSGTTSPLAIAMLLYPVAMCGGSYIAWRNITKAHQSISTTTPQNVSGQGKTNPTDGAEMVWIPEGDFLMGDSDRSDNPRRTVTLDGYWIYKTPVTVAQYRQFCTAKKRKMPDPPSWGWKDDHPIVNVTWDDASAYAQWAGVKLPTEAQWEKAARGTNGKKYPWGNDWDRSKCANSVIPNKMSSAAPVGSYPQGASPYGVLDMAGNVWEWCADWYDANYFRTAPNRNPSGPASGTRRVLRGGAWYNGKPDDFRASDRFTNAPATRFSVLGFRCAAGV